MALSRPEFGYLTPFLDKIMVETLKVWKGGGRHLSLTQLLKDPKCTPFLAVYQARKNDWVRFNFGANTTSRIAEPAESSETADVSTRPVINRGVRGDGSAMSFFLSAFSDSSLPPT